MMVPTVAMELERYIEEIHRQLTVTAEASGEEARALADRLAAPLDAAIRLALQDALSAAAEEITVELAPGSVELRLRGRNPEFVVTPPPADPTADDADADEEGPTRLARRRRRRGLRRADQPPSARAPEGPHRTSRGRRRAVGQFLAASGHRPLHSNAARALVVANGSTPHGAQRYTGWAR